MDNEKLEYATKYDLNSLDKRITGDIKENREYIDEHSKAIARLEAVYNSLEGLPLTITNLDKTITVIGSKLESMDKNLEDVKESISQQEEAINEIRKENKGQNEEITKIDNKSKIDWAEFVTKNFWKVFGIIAVLYAVIRSLPS